MVAREVEAFHRPLGIVGEQSDIVSTLQKRSRQLKGVEAAMDDDRNLHLYRKLVVYSQT